MLLKRVEEKSSKDTKPSQPATNIVNNKFNFNIKGNKQSTSHMDRII